MKIMDGQTRYLKIRELESELHSTDTSDDRCIELLAEIRKLKEPAKKVKRQPKKEREQYMTVLGGYVLDMHNHGLLVGFRDDNGNIRDKKTGKVIS